MYRNLYPNLHVKFNIYPNPYLNAYNLSSDVVSLFRIFSSMLTFSTAFLQKAKRLRKYHKQAEGVMISYWKLILKIVYFGYEYQLLIQ